MRTSSMYMMNKYVYMRRKRERKKLNNKKKKNWMKDIDERRVAKNYNKDWAKEGERESHFVWKEILHFSNHLMNFNSIFLFFFFCYAITIIQRKEHVNVRQFELFILTCLRIVIEIFCGILREIFHLQKSVINFFYYLFVFQNVFCIFL